MLCFGGLLVFFLGMKKKERRKLYAKTRLVVHYPNKLKIVPFMFWKFVFLKFY